MNEPGGAPDFQIAKGTIQIGADLAPLEESKQQVGRIVDGLSEQVKDKLGAAFKSVFDEADHRIEQIRTAMNLLSIGAPSQPHSDTANPNTGNSPDQILSRLSTIDSTVSRIAETADAISESLSSQED